MATRRIRFTTRRLIIAVAVFATVFWSGLCCYRRHVNMGQAERYAGLASSLRSYADAELRGGGPFVVGGTIGESGMKYATVLLDDHGWNFVAGRPGESGMKYRDLVSAFYRQADAYDRASRSYRLAAFRWYTSPRPIPSPSPIIYNRAVASKP